MNILKTSTIFQNFQYFLSTVQISFEEKNMRRPNSEKKNGFFLYPFLLRRREAELRINCNTIMKKKNKSELLKQLVATKYIEPNLQKKDATTKSEMSIGRKLTKREKSQKHLNSNRFSRNKL